MASRSSHWSSQRAPQHGQEPDLQALPGVAADHRPGQRRREERLSGALVLRRRNQHDHAAIVERDHPLATASRTIETRPIQMSFGSGTIEGNTFVNAKQPIRGPYDNSQGGVFVIRSNVFTTTGNRDACTGVTIDGTYQLVFERNTLECFRGLRLGWQHAGDRSGQPHRRQPSPGRLDRGNAVASLSGNTITNNGLSPGTEPAGGVVVWENGRADLGGGALTLGRTDADQPR